MLYLHYIVLNHSPKQKSTVLSPEKLSDIYIFIYIISLQAEGLKKYRKRAPVPTKKSQCTAKISIKKIVKFPDYQVGQSFAVFFCKQ